jgi:hypothetical protein
MNKLLSLLGAVGLIATSSATVVSRGDPDKGTSNNGGNDDYEDAVRKMSDYLIAPKNDDGKYDLDDVTLTDSNTIQEFPDFDGESLLGSIAEQLILKAVNPDCLTNGSNKVMNEFATKWDEYDQNLNIKIADLTYDAGETQTITLNALWENSEKDEQGHILMSGVYGFQFVVNNLLIESTK